MMEKQHLHGYYTVFATKLPDARVLRVYSRSLLLAVAIATLFIFWLFLKQSIVSELDVTATALNAELLNLILHDFGEEGLLKKEDKVLIVDPPRGLVNVESDDESYDFVFIHNSEDAVLADSILKINGIVAFPLINDPSHAGFLKWPNYRVVYLKRYGSTIVALRKIGVVNGLVDSSPKRKLSQLAPKTKTSALKGLEDPLLEPPRQEFANSNKKLKIKYLPELLGDSLEGYKRRVFVGVGLHEENRMAVEWFEKNYPKKSAKFQIHSVVVPEEGPVVSHIDVSAWLWKHVKEEDFVVMKAEANVVEEMMKKGTISLVDELFLECNNEWWHTGKSKKNGRAYWECLALYGRLKDEGVAVHQWWN